MKSSIDYKIQVLQQKRRDKLNSTDKDIKCLDYKISKIKEIQQNIKILKEYYEHKPSKIIRAILGDNMNIFEIIAIKILSRRKLDD